MENMERLAMNASDKKVTYRFIVTLSLSGQHAATQESNMVAISNTKEPE